MMAQQEKMGQSHMSSEKVEPATFKEDCLVLKEEDRVQWNSAAVLGINLMRNTTCLPCMSLARHVMAQRLK